MEQRRFRKLLVVTLLTIILFVFTVIGPIPDKEEMNLNKQPCLYVQGACITYENLVRTVEIQQLPSNY